MQTLIRRIPATARRALCALLLATACGRGFAEERCYSWGMNSFYLVKEHVAVVMRIDGGISDLLHYMSLALPESELPLSAYFDDETRASFLGENRFSHTAKFLVIKTIKGDLDPVIVLNGFGVNNLTFQGKLELIGLDDPLPDGTYEYNKVFRTVFHEHLSLTESAHIFGGPNGLRITCYPLDPW